MKNKTIQKKVTTSTMKNSGTIIIALANQVYVVPEFEIFRLFQYTT
jgi:hypothetical protein